MTGLGYNQRRHIRQMAKLRNKEPAAPEEETKWQPLNIPCMGMTCHCYGSPACKGKSVCNALF